MVSKVFPAEELEASTLAFARRIARVPTMAALLIKEAVNQTVDQMGFSNALASAFTLHALNHSYWEHLTPDHVAIGTPEFGVPSWKDAPPVRDRERSNAGGEPDRE
jgi:enoyl-CoA hydratase